MKIMTSTDIFTPRVKQVIAAISAGLLMIMMMITWGYPASILPQLEEEDSGIQMSTEQSSWFSAVTLMMCIPVSVVGVTAYEWFGPRKTMMTLTPVLGLSSALMAVASLKPVQDHGIAEILIISCRVLQGFVAAFLNPLISLYTYEICDQHIRGLMTSLVNTWMCLGFFLSYLSGCYLSWPVIACVLPVAILVPSFIGLLVSPESPLWLARKGRREEAMNTLNGLRYTEEEVKEDFDSALVSVQKNKDSISLHQKFRRMITKPNIKAILTTCLVVILNRTTGMLVIAIYIVHIFHAAGIGLEPKWSSVVVGASRVVCSLIACLMLHRLPRRPMLAVGNAITGLSSLVLGTFFYYQYIGYDISFLYWLPLLCLLILTIGYTITVGPTTLLISVELLPGSIRSIGHGMAKSSFAIAAFVLSKLFVYMEEEIGMHGIFFFFAGGSFSYMLVSLICIPETYGKTMMDIQNYWSNSKLEGRNEKRENVHI